jgi:hypothetical protein
MRRTNLVLFGVSALVACALACSSAKPATPVAPTSSGPTASTDGSTLKTSAPALQSPSNGARLTSTTVVLTASASTPQFATGVPLQYRFQVMNPAGTVVAQALVGSPTWTVTPDLTAFNTQHTWRVRAEYLGEAGPWSNTMSFITVEPFLINDPLTNGSTVGRQLGGAFVPGGWQSRSLTDGIDYDVPTCVSCRLEFDLSNVGPTEGFAFERDLKVVSMGDASAFSSFGAFRDHPWKMHLVQRADFTSGWEIIWRNGGTAPEGDPGDHRIKLTSSPVTMNSSQTFHFLLDWDTRGYSIAINGITVMQDGWDHWYEPPNFRISLGCYPRGDSFIGATYKNVTLKKLQ